MGIKPIDNNSGSMIRVKDLRRMEKRTPLADMLRLGRAVLLPRAPFSEYPVGVVYSAPYFARIEKIVKQSDPFSAALIVRAFNYAMDVHQNQRRKSSGEPYIAHPIAVAQKVAELGFSGEEIAAALLHDTIEDGGGKVTKQKLAGLFGQRVAEMVDDITEAGKEPGARTGKPPLIEIFRKILGAQHVSSWIIKLCDRRDNLITLDYINPKKRMEKANETLFFYAKIADILGMWEMKRELEELSFRHFDPENHQSVKNRRERLIVSSQQEIEEIIGFIRQKMIDKKLFSKEEVARIRLVPEARGVYELYQRLTDRGKLMEDLSAADIWRLNVVVPSEPLRKNLHSTAGFIQDSCYPSDPIQNFISNRRMNDHRLLHFYVNVAKFGKLLIQVRNEEMWRKYHIGVVAEIENGRLPPREAAKLLGTLGDYAASEGVTGKQFYELAKRGTIAVFTQDNNRIQLPYGATALDFAIKIDPGGFITSSSARINDTSPGLSTVLQEGDVVIIMKDAGVRPTLEWVKWVQTPLASLALRQYFSSLPKEVIRENALNALNAETEKNYLLVNSLIKCRSFLEFIAAHRYGSVKRLLLLIGTGRLEAQKVMDELMAFYNEKVVNYRGRRIKYAVSIAGEDRIGMLEDIIRPLKKSHINMSKGQFKSYKKKEMMMARIKLTFELNPRVQDVQRLLIKTIIARTAGVAQFNETKP